MKVLQQYNVKLKLMALIAIAVTLMLITSVYQLHQTYQSDIEDRKSAMQEQVKAAVSLVQYYSNKYPSDQALARQEAKSALEAMRFEGNNYFWVIDTNNTLIMHPLRQSQVGESMKMITDASGKQHWLEMTTIGSRSGEGFLTYAWIAPSGEVSEKISYVENFSHWNWVIGTGVHFLDIESRFLSSVVGQIGALVIVLVILIAAGVVIGNDICDPLNQLTKRVKQLEQGDLTQDFRMKRNDEIGDISSALHSASQSMRSTLQLASDSTQQSVSMSSTIAAATQQWSHSITEQHQQLAQLAIAMEEMSSTINEVARNAETASNSTSEINGQVIASNRLMNTALASIHNVSKGIKNSDERVGDLKMGVEEISNVTQVIQGVSEQTNLLALNAAIEAARAGEQGRGFAVVADEVRSLASRTQQSTIEIQETISKLNDSSVKSVQSMSECTDQTRVCVDNTEQIQQALERIASLVSGANDMIIQVATATEQQGTVTEEINSTVTNIHKATDEISQGAQHLTSESQALNLAASELNDRLKEFTV
ncbi:methyl-accepting chemotaxis protein [uncultured Vibrio sp.]|uniref:methyl-accepting chemotaxis protein n=1 Tax=uncultured Vibrio sp. TaxID=114054 RepID=UPI0025E326FB|nr:methyl-accepting chemotaxis protein [uncultured Vibrio sp.]